MTNTKHSQQKLRALAVDIVNKGHWPEPVTTVEFLPKGYSTDKKFLLHVAGRPRYMLRLCDRQLEQQRRGEFDRLGLITISATMDHRGGTCAVSRRWSRLQEEHE